MKGLTGYTTAQVTSMINEGMRKGVKLVNYAYLFSKDQLVSFIDNLYEVGLPTTKETDVQGRNLSQALVIFLYELNKTGKPTKYSEIKDLIFRECDELVLTDYASCKYWRLTEPTGKGYWRVTARGQAFLEGKLSLAKTVFVKNDTVVSASSERINIKDFQGLEMYAWEEKSIDYGSPVTISLIVNKQSDKVNSLLNKLSKDDPAKFVDLFIKLAGFIQPKLSRTEVEGNVQHTTLVIGRPANLVLPEPIQMSLPEPEDPKQLEE